MGTDGLHGFESRQPKWILDFEKDQKPKIHEYLEKIKSEKEIIIFKSHREVDDFIASLA